jgi:hypothetical protein
MFHSLEQFAQFTQRTFIFFREFKEHSGVGNFGFELFLTLDGSLETAPFLQKLLGSFLVRPKIRRGGLAFDLV